MAVAVINHRLDLALRIIDTTTGKPVAGNELKLSRDGKPLNPMEKERGTLIFPELGRSDFTLTVSSRNYEQTIIPISYSELDEKLPLMELQLIPTSSNIIPVPCLTLEGCMPGITELTAVKMGASSCLIREFEPRKRLATIFNPHKLELDRTHYALVDPDKLCYERFRIEKRVSDSSIRLDHLLETEFGNYFPICPVVFGKTAEDGSYCLRVRDDAKNVKWLIGYKIGQEHHYICLDLKESRMLPDAAEEAPNKKVRSD